MRIECLRVLHLLILLVSLFCFPVFSLAYVYHFLFSFVPLLPACFSVCLQPPVLRDGVRPTDGLVGRLLRVRPALGPVGRQHVWRVSHGGVLAAVRLARARLPSPPGRGGGVGFRKDEAFTRCSVFIKLNLVKIL